MFQLWMTMVNDCMTIMVDWLMMIDYGCTWYDYDLPWFDYVLPKLNMINYKCAWFRYVFTVVDLISTMVCLLLMMIWLWLQLQWRLLLSFHGLTMFNLGHPLQVFVVNHVHPLWLNIAHHASICVTCRWIMLPSVSMVHHGSHVHYCLLYVHVGYSWPCQQ